MKKLLIATTLFLSLAATGFSQEKSEPKKRNAEAREQLQKKSPEERAQFMTDALAKKLSLSDKQKQEVYKVNLERAKQMEQFKSEKQNERRKDFAKSKELFEASDNKINKILNDDQKKAYAELKAERKAKAQSHKGEFRKDGRKKRSEA